MGYIRYFLTSPLFQRQAAALAVGSVLRYFGPSNLRKISFVAPPIEEQRAIAGVLESLDYKIEQNRHLAIVIERLIEAIFRSWFVDFEPVRAKGSGARSFPSVPPQVFDNLTSKLVDSVLGPVPDDWKIRSISDVVPVVGGATPSTKVEEYWDGGVHCWATPKDMSRLAHPVLLDTERHITDAGLDCISSGLLPPGTVLMSSRAPIGYLAITTVHTAINQGFIGLLCNGPLPPTYVLNWARASMDAIQARASGTTFPEINKKSFRPLPVVVPPESVVSAFRAITDTLFERLVASVNESRQLEELRDYLLPRLLSGESRVVR